MNIVEIKKTMPFEIKSEDQKYIEGVVYKANERDAHETVKSMADRFMKLYGQGKASIDFQHNRIPGTGYITKNYVDDKGWWYMGSNVEDDSTWDYIKKGYLKGYSIDGKGMTNNQTGETINPQINLISVVEKPANMETFSLIKSEEQPPQTTKEKIINFVNSIFGNEEKPMNNNIEQKIDNLEKSMTNIAKSLESITKEETPKEENPVEQRLSKLEEINKSIADQVAYLTGGVSQVPTLGNIEKSTDEISDEELFASL